MVLVINELDMNELGAYLKTYDPDVMDLDSDTTRVTTGDIVRDRIAVKHKIKLELVFVPKALASRLLQALSPEFVPVTYENPETGTSDTRTFYTGDRNLTKLYDGIYSSIKFNLTQK